NAAKIQLPANWFRRCEFPLILAIPKTGNPPIPCSLPAPYNIFAKTLPGISKQAFAFIESVQPYYGVGEVNNCLRFLAELSNIDKHRHLNVIHGRVRKTYTIRFASGLVSSGSQALDHGGNLPREIGWSESDRPVYVHRRLRAFVTFEEKGILGDASTLPMDYLLQLILKQIKTVIIPAFGKFTKKH
ncbi:MAG: hypothetical protein LAO04_21960, partial [Acidobacteriia bacterium]|nr:hypothetical protein [Terriglobia bacterium]